MRGIDAQVSSSAEGSKRLAGGSLVRGEELSNAEAVRSGIKRKRSYCEQHHANAFGRESVLGDELPSLQARVEAHTASEWCDEDDGDNNLFCWAPGSQPPEGVAGPADG